MTRRTQPSATPETDADKVVEAIRVLSGTFENVASELSMLNDTADRIRDDIKYLTNQYAEVFRMIHRMPLDPASTTWAADLAAMNPSGADAKLCSSVVPASAPVQSKLSEATTVQCDGCDRQVTPADAKSEGWTDVARWNGGGHAAFLGICPGCIGGESEPKNPTPAPRSRGQLF